MNEEKDIFDFIEKRKVETPDKAYFDNLAQSVLDSQKTKVIPLYKRPISWISVAAAAVLVLFVVNFNTPGDIPESNEWATLDDVPKEELLAYVEDNIEDFDIELIAEFVPTEEINSKYEELENEMTIEEEIDPIESITFESVSKEEILEYLEDEGLDFSDLEDEDSFI